MKFKFYPWSVSKATSHLVHSIRLTVVILLALLTTAHAQVYEERNELPTPCPNCTSEDIKLVKVYLGGQYPTPCPEAGSLVTLPLLMDLNVTAKERYGLLVTADIYINEVFSGKIIYKCFEKTFTQGPKTDTLVKNFTFTAGDKIALRHVMTAWDNNKPSGSNKDVYKVCLGYSLTNNTYDCKMMTDTRGVSLTPKCKYYEVFLVKTPARPVIAEPVITPVVCNGESNGAVNISVTPATQTYTYSWSGPNGFTASTEDISGLKAGTYTVVVSTDVCSASATATVTQPDAIAATTNQQNVKCKGSATGKAWVVGPVTGGTPYPGSGPEKYHYSWNTTPVQTSDTATGLTAGTYVVTISDALSCSITRTVTITEPSEGLAATTYVKNNVSCNGGADGKAYVHAEGGTPPYSYSWNTTPEQTGDTASGLVAGAYSVTVTDANNCPVVKQVTITEPPVLNFSTSIVQSPICPGSTTTITVTASGGTAPYEYKLDEGDYQASNSFTVEPGTYNITVKDANGCTTTKEVTVAEKDCSRFCTYTQGYFGTDNPGKASYDNGGGCTTTETRTTIQASLNWWAVNGKLRVGNIQVSDLGNPVQAILNYLPGGGPSINYTGNTLGAGTTPNTLLSQTLTLGLNIGLNQYMAGYKFKGNIITQDTYGSCGEGSLVSGSCHERYTLSEFFQNQTIKQIFDSASRALVSGSQEERNMMAGIAGAINEAFDGCAKAVSSCPPFTIASESLTQTNRNPAEGFDKNRISVKTFPNPVSGVANFLVTAPVAGDAVIELYDLSGRKIQTLRHRNLAAGQETLITCVLPKIITNNQVMYKITLANFTFNGKLIVR